MRHYRWGRAWRRTALAVLVAASLLWGPARGRAAGYDWLQFDGTAQHSGANTQEAMLTTGNVSSLQQVFRDSLSSYGAGAADSAPAYLSGVSTATGTKDLLFLTTKDGHILALDAHSKTTSAVWSHAFTGSCTSSNGSACVTTSSPAIDPNRQYVYSYGLDGYVHKYQVGNGTEITGNGWPELATRKPDTEKGSSALGIASTSSGSYLYVANGGYPGDYGDYQGHVTTINLATGAQHVFTTLCSNQLDAHFVKAPTTPSCGATQSAVWARPGVIYDPDTNGGSGSIFFATGNGAFAPGSFDWGDSVLELNPDGTGSSTTTGNPLDSYTPTNYAQLQSSDADLGSTAPAILPVPASSSIKHVAVQGGKDGYLRLLNLDNLSGQGGPGHVGGEIASMQLPSPISGEVLTQPAVWTNPADGSTWVFVVDNNGVGGFKLTVNASGTPGLQLMWSVGLASRASLGSSPLVANGILFDARNNLIEARDPVTGKQLWQDTSIGGIHWESPIVANGMLYISDESGQLTGYALPHLVVTAPAGTASGSAFSLTVTPQSASGGTLTGYTGTVHFTSTDGNANLPADYTFTAADSGSHTFTVTLRSPGAQTVTAADTTTSTISGTSASIQVNPLTVTVQAGAGWNLVGGDPLTLWTDSSINWAWNASTGQWYHPTGAEGVGTGTWEYISTAGSHSVNAMQCSATVTVSVVAYRYNMVGNPCSSTVYLPKTIVGAHLWSAAAGTYVPTTSIPPGAAAWVKPVSNSLPLSPNPVALLARSRPRDVPA